MLYSYLQDTALSASQKPQFRCAASALLPALENNRAKEEMCKSLGDFARPQGCRKRGWPDIASGAGRVVKRCSGGEGIT